MDVLAPRAGNYRGKRQVAGAYPKAFSMNSMPKNASTERTATSISTNTMPKAIMRSLAASLLMSHGMLGNVNGQLGENGSIYPRPKGKVR